MSAGYKDDFAKARASIGAVLKKRNALEKWLDNRVKKLIDVTERNVKKHLHELGKKAVDKARKNISNTTGSGRTYTYVDKSGNILATHTSSDESEFPASFSFSLRNAIEYRMTSDLSVTIGVWSMAEGGKYPTVRMVKEYKRRNPDTGEMVELFDVVIVDEEKGKRTSIAEYANILEHGSDGGLIAPRPFLGPSMKEAVEEFRKNLSKDLRSDIEKTMKRKVPIYFRIYVSKHNA
ncbi:MAG: hypothetical protein RBR32_01615 [Bacteroidales bacterium]|nr:hypothetical protein [Bacteroidales bacterium]